EKLYRRSLVNMQNNKSKDKVSIIILNWNGWEDTIECLESLYQITYPNYNVIVVDNSSEDDSIERIKEYREGRIKVESTFFNYDPSNKPIKIIEYTREETETDGGKEREILDLPSNRKMILIKNDKNYGFAEGNVKNKSWIILFYILTNTIQKIWIRYSLMS
ncbi:unnamed protein product, partial [marine sediment metagenome]